MKLYYFTCTCNVTTYYDKDLRQEEHLILYCNLCGRTHLPSALRETTVKELLVESLVEYPGT